MQKEKINQSERKNNAKGKIESILDEFNLLNNSSIARIKRTKGQIEEIKQLPEFLKLKYRLNIFNDKENRLATILYLLPLINNTQISFGKSLRPIDESLLLKYLSNKSLNEQYRLNGFFRILKRIKGKTNLMDFVIQLFFLEEWGYKNILKNYYMEEIK